VDLYGITANVTHIRLLPVDFRAIVALVVAALLPLLPVGVASLPVGSVLHFAIQAREDLRQLRIIKLLLLFVVVFFSIFKK